MDVRLAGSWRPAETLLLPGVSRLARMVATVRSRARVRAWRELARLADDEGRVRLERLLVVPLEQRPNGLTAELVEPAQQLPHPGLHVVRPFVAGGSCLGARAGLVRHGGGHDRTPCGALAQGVKVAVGRARPPVSNTFRPRVTAT